MSNTASSTPPRTRRAAALDGAVPAAPQVLLSGIGNARVAYRVRGTWNDGWPGGTAALPAAIELALDLDGIGQVTPRFLLPGERS